MPIKPENKHLYPENWDEISHTIRVNRAKNKCERCGVVNHSILNKKDRTYPAPHVIGEYYKYRAKFGKYEALKRFDLIEIVLTVAHLDHDPTHNDLSNLAALCQRCHNRHDAKHRAATRKYGNFRNQIQIVFK